MENAVFDQVLVVIVKSPGQDDRNAGIRISLESISVTSPVHRKELHVRLTDDNDPFLLYNLHLGEEDFQFLKSQQGLLVDFSAFPQKFIELLQLCAQSEGKEHGKFVLHLSQPTDLSLSSSHSLAHLSVIETNPFKHLTHLSLSFKPGTDAEVKQYLAKCLNTLQEDHKRLKAHLNSQEKSLSHQLQQTKELLQSRSSELERLRGQWSSQTDSQGAKHQQEMAEERQKAVEIQRDLEKKSSAQLQDLEERHRKQSEKLQSRVSEVQAVNREMHERRQIQESTIKELRSKLHMLEEDYQRAQRELQSTRRHTDKLETEHVDREQAVGQLRTRVAVLEQEVHDKQALADKSSQLLEAANENKAQLEDSVYQKQGLIMRLESTVKSTSKEVLKGNDIIRKLQGELKASVAKLKLKNTVTSKQEKLLEERSQTLHKTEQENNALQKKANAVESENERLKESLERTTAKLEESRQLLKTNENVINWLNKQVNEAQLSHRHGTFEPPRGAPITSYKPGGVPFQPGFNPMSNALPGVGPTIPMTLTSTPAMIPGIPLSTPHTGLSAITRTSSSASPALDPKYLQTQAPPTIGAASNHLSTGSQRPPSQPRNSPQPIISQTHPGPAPVAGLGRRPTTANQGKPASGQAQPPLMSAYFPRSLQTAS